MQVQIIINKAETFKIMRNKYHLMSNNINNNKYKFHFIINNMQ